MEKRKNLLLRLSWLVFAAATAFWYLWYTNQVEKRLLSFIIAVVIAVIFHVYKAYYSQPSNPKVGAIEKYKERITKILKQLLVWRKN
jgi:predicted PurR-regulated permease PerM